MRPGTAMTDSFSGSRGASTSTSSIFSASAPLSARYEKARRGELVVAAPVGFVKDGDRYEKDPDRRVQEAITLVFGALHGSLRHSVGGRDPQEGDDEDADNSFGRRGFGPRWADVAPAQARCGGTPVAGGGSGDPLAGARRHRRDSDGMAGHLCGGR